jgi:protein-disulfide isomerase
MLKIIKKGILLMAVIFSASLLAQPERTDAQIEESALKVSNRLFQVNNSPTAGTGDLTLVLFYDYNCPYSRILDKQLRAIITENKVRVIYRPVGLIDSASPIAARAVLAAHKQGKFEVVNDAFINETKPLTQAMIQSIIAQPNLGIDQERYKKDFDDLSVEGQVFENRIVYEEISMAGVPAIIGAKLDTSNNVVSSKIKYFAGVNRQDLVYMLYKLRS